MYSLMYIPAVSGEEKRTRIAASPFVFGSSGGRIRTSDLRVMSVIRSKTTSLEITRTYGNPKALRPWASATHDTHGTAVFPLVMYRMMYQAHLGSHSRRK